jgi:hypothetical protein
MRLVQSTEPLWASELGLWLPLLGERGYERMAKKVSCFCTRRNTHRQGGIR